jgi:hypothetical protein
VRGLVDHKVKLAVELNEACQCVSSHSYGRINTIDLFIKNCRMFYMSWKYRHASKLYVQAFLGLVAAYNMYKEEGFAAFGFDLKEEAICKFMVNFHGFQDQLLLQGLYATTHWTGNTRWTWQ